jgi:hypothetical protein
MKEVSLKINRAVYVLSQFLLSPKGRKVFLVSVIALAGALRMYRVSMPIADNHSWRQTDSAAVIRNLAVEKFDLLRPRWNNLVATNGRGLPNPERYFFEDFPPAFDMYAAFFYQILGGQVIAFRLPAIIFSLLTIVFLFYLVGEITDFRLGALAALIYAVLPFSVFFSRGVFQEVALNFYVVAGLYFLHRYLKRPSLLLFILAIVMNALLFLTKPYALVYLLPEVFLFFQKGKWGIWKDKRVWAYFLLSLIPFGLWWLWTKRFPEGMPYSGWLFNEGNIRFKGSFFYWIFAQRLGLLILGIYGVLFFGLGLVTLGGTDGLFYAWLVSLLVYVSVIAKGNVTHEYYQVPLLPVVAFFSAKGMVFLLSLSRRVKEKLAILLMVAIFFLSSLAFSWYHLRNFYDLQAGVDLAGDFIDKNTPKEALIIAGAGADPTLLYNTNRHGWTVGYGSVYENKEGAIEELIKKGARFYVTTTINQIKGTSFENYLRQHFSVLKETDQFIVFSLSQGR